MKKAALLLPKEEDRMQGFLKWSQMNGLTMPDWLIFLREWCSNPQRICSIIPSVL